MVLVDTSVWVEHLRAGEAQLAELLLSEGVLCHPFVIGELACGNLANRAEVLRLLDTLPKAMAAADDEARDFIESARLMGRGIGWVDVHLLASAQLSRTRLWSMDRRLKGVATELGLAFPT